VVDLDVRLLRAFVAVADELSFSRAAERLELAQQGLSAQVRQLEARLGARVFTRTTRRVALTPAGEALLPHAHAALEAIEAGIEAVREVDALAMSELAVAGLAEAGPLGREIVDRFDAASEEVAVVERDVSPPQQLLDEGGGPPLAVAFVRPPCRGVNRLALVTRGAAPRRGAQGGGPPRAPPRTLEPGELMVEPWAWVGAADRVAEIYWLLEEHRHGRSARIAGRPHSYGELMDAVAKGEAVGLVPASVAEVLAADHPGVRFVAVDGIEPSRLALAWRPAAETPQVRELVEIARTVARE
jgi:DNA-binding transcriptional LysR family regulator